MKPACAKCTFGKFQPQHHDKSYAMVLLTGIGPLQNLWTAEMDKAKTPSYLAPMYTHCEQCQHACWIARNDDPQAALQEHLTDRVTWDQMWLNVQGLGSGD